MIQEKRKLPADPSPSHPLGNPHRSGRRERRSPLSVLLRICGFSANGRIFSEVVGTRNISPSGCCLRLRTRPLGHAVLALQVIPREGLSPNGGAQMLYQVAWLQPHGHFWDVGLAALGRTDLLRVAFASPTP
jgi:hypothetical protein